MSPEFETLYNNVTKAVEELMTRLRENDLEEAEDSIYEAEMQQGSILGHWACTVSYVGIDENNNTKNSIYNISSPGADAITALGLYKVGLMRMEQCI